MLKDVMIASSVATSVAVATYLWRSKKYNFFQSQPPKNWIQIGVVENLYFYPLKSGAPVSNDFINCSDFGPFLGEARDRSFIVVDTKGDMKTGRDYPKLTQIHASIKEGTLNLNYENDSLELDLKPLKTIENNQIIRIWRTNTKGVNCGPRAAEWLSNVILGKPEGLELLYYPPEKPGKLPDKKLFELPFVTKTDGGVFSDASSFHLVSQASLRELNSRLKNPVKALNFRPNIVVEGEKMLPFEEDRWEWLRIGDVTFRKLGPCTRCLFTTVDPEIGSKSSDTEPLKTLRKYRVLRDPREKARFGSSPVMGIYLGLRSNSAASIISVGNPVFVPA